MGRSKWNGNTGDHSLGGCSYSIFLRMMSLSSLPSFSKLRMPCESRSVAILLLFISQRKLSSEASTGAMGRSFAFSADSRTGTSPPLTLSSSRRVGEMVSLSQPHSYLISPVLRKDAPITTVLMPKYLQQLQISVTDCTPGSSAGLSQVLLCSFLFQSRMRPTKGEMRKSLASAQAMACILWKTRVMLQRILFLSRASPALIPSQVVAILMRMRSVLTPACSQRAISLRARLMVSFLLKESLASTSVDTKPLIFSRILTPKDTQRWSQTSSTRSSRWSSVSFSQQTRCSSIFFLAREWVPQQLSKKLRPNSTEAVRMLLKSGRLATWRMRVGLVVESSGWYFSMRLKSPVSATTRLCRFSCSSSHSSTLIFFWGSPSIVAYIALINYIHQTHQSHLSYLRYFNLPPIALPSDYFKEGPLCTGLVASTVKMWGRYKMARILVFTCYEF